MATFTLRRRKTTTQTPAPGRLVGGAPTEADVLTALSSIGVPALQPIALPLSNGLGIVSPVRVDGEGWRIEVDLPFGVTVEQVLARRAALASGLRCPADCVWPMAADVHPGRLSLWIARRPLRERPGSGWIVPKCGALGISAPLPFGINQYGKAVYIRLGGTHVLLAGAPRTGLSRVALMLALSAGQDPDARVWVFDPRGAGDFAVTARFAERYESGFDDSTADAMLAHLRELRAEMDQRFATLKTHGVAGVPGAGMPPIVVVIDECQELFHHARHHREATDLVADVLRRGRAARISVVLAAGNPDAQPIPAQIRDNIPVRFCLRVAGRYANDQVLGTGAYRTGLRATDLTHADTGIGILLGDNDDDPRTVRAFHVTPATAEHAADRAAALRNMQDRGADPDPATGIIGDLADALDTIEFADGVVSGPELLNALRSGWANTYDTWTPRYLVTALSAHGVPTVAVRRRTDGRMTVRRGYTRAALAAAVGRNATG